VPVDVASQPDDDAAQLGARDAHPLERVPGELEGGFGVRIGQAADAQEAEGVDLALATDT
jgi:hypothetical protein